MIWFYTQQDPIGIAGGLNLYGFARGDPINFSDPFGLDPCEDLEGDELEECQEEEEARKEAAREERAACYANNRFSALFPDGAARNTVELIEMGSAISLAGDLVATSMKATRAGVGGTTTAYASGFNMIGRNAVQAGGNLLQMSPNAIGRGVGMVNSVGNKLTPTMAVIGAFTLAYNTTIQAQCHIGSIN